MMEKEAVDGVSYRRLCIKTHVIKDGDSIPDVAMEYAAPHMQEGDVLFITERRWPAPRNEPSP